MHEFFNGSGFQISKFRKECRNAFRKVDAQNLLEDDFLNPFGFEVSDTDEIIILKDLKRFYIYLRSKTELSFTQKSELFNNFISLFSKTFPKIGSQIGVIILENSKVEIIKNATVFRTIGKATKLICVNFIKSETPLLQYYSDYIISTLPGLAFRKAIESIRYSESFTKNLRAIQLYIILEKLFGNYTNKELSSELLNISKSFPSNYVSSYFERVQPTYDESIILLIEKRLKTIYDEVSLGEDIVFMEIQDINDNGILRFRLRKSVYEEVTIRLQETYKNYGGLSSVSE